MMHPWCTMMHRTEKIWKDDRKIRCGERWRELSTPRQISAIQRFRELWISFFSKFLEIPSNSLHFLVAVMVAMWILRCEVKRTIAARRLKDAKARSDKISACPWAAHVSSMCHPCVIHVSSMFNASSRIESMIHADGESCWFGADLVRFCGGGTLWKISDRKQRKASTDSRKTERTAFLRSILKGYFWFSVGQFRKKSAAFDWSTLTRWKNAALFFQNIF